MSSEATTSSLRNRPTSPVHRVVGSAAKATDEARAVKLHRAVEIGHRLADEAGLGAELYFSRQTANSRCDRGADHRVEQLPEGIPGQHENWPCLIAGDICEPHIPSTGSGRVH